MWRRWWESNDQCSNEGRPRRPLIQLPYNITGCQVPTCKSAWASVPETFRGGMGCFGGLASVHSSRRLTGATTPVPDCHQSSFMRHVIDSVTSNVNAPVVNPAVVNPPAFPPIRVPVRPSRAWRALQCLLSPTPALWLVGYLHEVTGTTWCTSENSPRVSLSLRHC